jgi:hypothetical protein
MDMRIPNAAHESRPWRIRPIVPDFVLEDVWVLPAQGGPEDFPVLLELMADSDPANADSLPTRLLWRLRDRLGEWFDLGGISAPVDGGEGGLPIPGTNESSLSERLPEDLRGTATDVDFGSLPFVPLYLTESEFAAEISNRTVHGAMHLGWADQEDGSYQAQMAVYVKPRGRFGQAYMALIKPFRYLIVYPALTRQTERMWNARIARRAAATAARPPAR